MIQQTSLPNEADCRKQAGFLVTVCDSCRNELSRLSVPISYCLLCGTGLSLGLSVFPFQEDRSVQFQLLIPCLDHRNTSSSSVTCSSY